MKKMRLVKRMFGKGMLAVIMLVLMAGAACAEDAAGGTGMSFDEFFHLVDTYTINKEIPTYENYILANEGVRPDAEIIINGTEYIRYDSEEGVIPPVVLSNYEGAQGDALLTADDSLVEYQFTVDQAGWYDVQVSYYPYEGKNSEIQRAFFIDGKLPYNELALVKFPRIWKNGDFEKSVDENGVTVINWKKDNQGNDLRPSPSEDPAWTQAKLYDSNGYIMQTLSLYLTEGEHVLSMLALREPMLLHHISILNTDPILAYADIPHTLEEQAAREKIIRIEAENADRTSSQMLYPVQDQAAPDVYPASAQYLLNNSIGGNSWRLAGQWIEWDFDVEEAGYYCITLYDKQNFVRGIDVYRKISIDGKVPFQEFNAYPFAYAQNWRNETLGADQDTPYQFFLTEGKHTLRMEVVLGDMASIISWVQESVQQLNAIYRSVLYITGVSPDPFRDYQLEATLPNLEQQLIDAKVVLNKAIDAMKKTAGSNSEKLTVLLTMNDQLDELIEDQERFIEVLGSYRTNVRALGNWITQVLGQPLQMDRIYIHTPDVKPQNAATGLKRVGHEIERLYYSFVIDYNQVGNVADATNDAAVITLWIGAGRDQANVIKALIDEKFTPQTGIGVNLQLVNMGVLLQATLAGQGPDLIIQGGGGETPLNYGLRNAVLDLTRFEDFEEVTKRFAPSAMVPFTFEGAAYAIPDTLTFPMMFYRKDVLAEIGLEVPKTWDEVKTAMSVLSKNQMEFGMLPGDQVYAMLLYQNGGQFYSENGDRSALDSDVAVNTFKDYCEFYSDYKLDRGTSVEERFRTGEAPLIIADYTLYNNLQVSAPDIYGLWDFTTVPGTVKEDGTIDHTTACGGGANMIMKATKHPDECWEFLKWWTSAEIQTLYGLEMESLMGAAARVPTANLEALDLLGWPVQDYKKLAEQMETVRGIPQVPGSYYTWRNINHAFFSVVESGVTKNTTPREELMDRVYHINSEIDYKRTEFGLPLATDKEDASK